MNSQPQPDELQRLAAGLTKNLGQKDARREKRSEEKLRLMGDKKAKAELGQKDAKRKTASDKKLRQMKSGKPSR